MKVWQAAAISCLAIGLFTGTAQGQSLLLSGATVHTITGETLSPGNVLIKDGKIALVPDLLNETTNERLVVFG